MKHGVPTKMRSGGVMPVLRKGREEAARLEVHTAVVGVILGERREERNSRNGHLCWWQTAISVMKVRFLFIHFNSVASMRNPITLYGSYPSNKGSMTTSIKENT